MPVTLYGLFESPPLRSTLLTLNALNVPYDFVKVDLFAGEHLQEEFLKVSPNILKKLLKFGSKKLFVSLGDKSEDDNWRQLPFTYGDMCTRGFPRRDRD